MLVYNHAPFLQKALDGILMQQTDYSYEIIVSEDCSTDDSRRILIDYKERYPDKIRLILNDHNLGMEGNSKNLYDYLKAPYIAFCEGDDYWTDSQKLQKQISFLENNRQYAGSAHNVTVVDRDGCQIENNTCFTYQKEHIYSVMQARNFELACQTASLVCRNFYKDMSAERRETFWRTPCNGDRRTQIILGYMGGIYYFENTMSVYRRFTDGDSWNSKINNKNLEARQYDANVGLKNMVKALFNDDVDITVKLKNQVRGSFQWMIHQPSKENLRVFLQVVKKKDLSHREIRETIWDCVNDSIKRKMKH